MPPSLSELTPWNKSLIGLYRLNGFVKLIHSSTEASILIKIKGNYKTINLYFIEKKYFIENIFCRLNFIRIYICFIINNKNKIYMFWLKINMWKKLKNCINSIHLFLEKTVTLKRRAQYLYHYINIKNFLKKISLILIYNRRKLFRFVYFWIVYLIQF